METGVTQGKLGLNYDGTKVDLLTTAMETDGENTGWKTSGQTGEWIGEWTPGWSSRPKVYLQGYDCCGLTSVPAWTISHSRPVSNGFILYAPNCSWARDDEVPSVSMFGSDV